MKNLFKLFVFSIILFNQQTFAAYFEPIKPEPLSEAAPDVPSIWQPLVTEWQKQQADHLEQKNSRSIYQTSVLQAMTLANPNHLLLEITDPVYISVEHRRELFATESNKQKTLADLKQQILMWQNEHQPVYLNMSDVDLYTLPEDFFEDIHNIIALDLSHNNLMSLPLTLGQLQHSLMGLNVSNNLLSSTNALKPLKELRYLDLSYNNIEVIFLGIEEIPHIVWVDVSYNRLCQETPEFISLRQNARVDASNNPYTPVL